MTTDNSFPTAAQSRAETISTCIYQLHLLCDKAMRDAISFGRFSCYVEIDDDLPDEVVDAITSELHNKGYTINEDPYTGIEIQW